MAEKVVKDAGFQSNMEVDYVISYRFATTGSFPTQTMVDSILTAGGQIERLP